MTISPRNSPRKAVDGNSVLPTTTVPCAEEDDKNKGCSLAFLMVHSAGAIAKITVFLFVADILHFALAPIIAAHPTNNPQSLFVCPPEQGQKARNYAGTWTEDTHVQATSEMRQNLTSFLDTFEDKVFDAWGVTYNQVKERYQPWKTKYFAPYIKSGFSIYGSASGIGLNLLLTLKIVQQVLPEKVDNVLVYGNEYACGFQCSTVQRYLGWQASPASEYLCHHWQSVSRRLQQCSICTIQVNSMDLVYTGYITPLVDPLEHQKDKNYYVGLCNNNETVDAMQDKQETWYALWVKEMIRIAKPGAPVILEQVAAPLCEMDVDRGGVCRDFWTKAIDKFQLDVDPCSLVIEDEAVFGSQSKRYNVFMLRMVAARRYDLGLEEVVPCKPNRLPAVD